MASFVASRSWLAGMTAVAALMTGAAQAQTMPGASPLVPAFSPVAPAPAPAEPKKDDKPAAAQTQGDGAPAAQPPKPKENAKKTPPAPPRETALSDDPAPSFSPETFFTTPKALDRYLTIAAQGGWPQVRTLAPGSVGADVATLRRRLAIEGDLDTAQEPGEAYDSALTEAVKAFQARHGLKRTGRVSGATLKAMNEPVETRIRQLEASAARLAGYSFSFGGRYIVSNLPSASVEAVANGQVVKRYVAVAGDVKHPSPEVEAKVGAINLNPTWTVPTSIIRKEIIPKMRKTPSYLSRAKIRVFDNQGQEVDPARIDWSTNQAVNYTLRQDSGPANSLGLIRIAMPNRHAVYMHDTPSKRQFALDYRFHSHGCVRVEGVYDLAAWILEGVRGGPSNGKWDRDAIAQRIATGAREDIRIPQPVPVAWVYLTGWASPDGRAHFRNDVYGLDDPTPGAQAKVEQTIR